MEIKKGQLIRWVDDKGFGFIKPENGKNDIFIHISALKGMSRKPVIGDIIHCEIGADNNGRTRAVNAKIEGVERILTIEPLKHKRKRDRPAPVYKRTYRKPRNTSKSPNNFNLLAIFIAIALAVLIYNKVSKEKIRINQVQAPTFEPLVIEQDEQFQCQGKVWCSEMDSYEEAVFYLNNCPGTKMDGDDDGDPCERQF